MNCQRCQGLMYRMVLRDRRSINELEAMVCLMCGEIVDPGVQLNRAHNLQKRSAQRRYPRLRARRRAVLPFSVEARNQPETESATPHRSVRPS